VFEYLLGVYEDHLQSYDNAIHNEHNESPEDHLAINLRTALLKAHNYYNKLNLSPAYYSATILHPHYKHYLDAVGADKPDWLESNNRNFQACRLHTEAYPSLAYGLKSSLMILTTLSTALSTHQVLQTTKRMSMRAGSAASLLLLGVAPTQTTL
jgi:hypothetical protein